MMGTMAFQITSLTIVYSSVYSGADQRKHQSSASPVTGEFPAQKASSAEKVSIWWRHHGVEGWTGVQTWYYASICCLRSGSYILTS